MQKIAGNIDDLILHAFLLCLLANRLGDLGFKAGISVNDVPSRCHELPSDTEYQPHQDGQKLIDQKEEGRRHENKYENHNR